MQQSLLRTVTVAQARDFYLRAELPEFGLAEFGDESKRTATTIEILQHAGVFQSDISRENDEAEVHAQDDGASRAGRQR